MRCIRILPDTWARTLWPLSISTRNIALGSGSTTLPSTSIASSLLMAFRPFIGVLDGRPMWMRAEMTTGAPNTMALATWTRRHEQEGADTREHITHPAPALIGFLAGSAPPHRSRTTFTSSATSLSPSCFVSTLTTQPGLRSVSASGCSTKPVLPGSVALTNLTILAPGLRCTTTWRVWPLAVDSSAMVRAASSVRREAVLIGQQRPRHAGRRAIATGRSRPGPTSDQALARRRRNAHDLDFASLPEPAIQAFHVLDDLEPLRLRHVAEAGHDPVAAEPDCHDAARATDPLRHCPEEVCRRWKLPRRRRAELELRAGEVTRLGRAARGQHRSDRAVALAVDPVAGQAGHHIYVATNQDALWMLPGHGWALMPGEGVLVRHDRPAILNRQFPFPRRHGRALRREGRGLAALAHAPEPVVVAHLGHAGLVAEVRRLKG